VILMELNDEGWWVSVELAKDILVGGAIR
jgi:hypothetical protein